tara:strand:+ start:16 stop:1476 length:1461 start_codon:yes stop_codon:yes gene_type:complete
VNQKKKKVVVIGAGIGGLSSAAILSFAGFDVTIIEQNEKVGGKANVLEKDGYVFDMGPSLLTLPEWIDEVFTFCLKNPRDYYTYKRLSTVTRYFFPDKSHLDVKSDLNDTAEEFEKVGLAKNQFLDFMRKWDDIYSISSKTFLENNIGLNKAFLSGALKWVKKSSISDLSTSMSTYNNKHISNDRVEMILNRFATYTGSSPFETPAFMNQLGVVEMIKGAYFPYQGIYSIPLALKKLCLELGVKIKMNCKVENINYRKKKFTIETKNETVDANVLLSNVDFFTTQKLLGRKINVKYQNLSTSCLVFYWGMKQEFPSLELHNILFTKDYKNEFEEIRKKELISDPSIYINISSKMEKSHAPSGCENWFVMINLPADVKSMNADVIKKLRELVILKISNFLKTNIEPLISVEEMLTPIDVQKRTGSHNGSLYGENQNSFSAIVNRKKNRDKKLRKLYYVGGTVRPGGGIPLAAKSGLNTAKLIVKNES